MEAAPAGIAFGDKKLRGSPYDSLILQLRDAGPGKFLKFSELRARPSLIARSKKLSVRLMFGEEGSTLWVALAKADLVADGKTDEEKPKTLAEIVLLAIDAKRNKAGEITTWARSNGAPGAGVSQVDEAIRNLCRDGKVKLKNAIFGQSDVEVWVRR